MIVRDEEGFLGDCLASLAGHVDEIVVVDTGSKDRTLEIAGAYGARVFSIPWPDYFSAARNVSVEHATGDWILWIDADDRLRVPKGVSLPALLDDPKAAGATVTMQWRSDATACRELRLFRNDPRIRFAGIIYENVLESLDVVCRAEGLVIRDTPLRIDHLGYETDLTPKHRRNLALLRRAVAERPDQPFYWSRLGESLAALGEVAEAIEACRTAIELAPNLGPGIERGELAFAYQTLARLLAEAGEPVEKVLDTIDQGLRWRPDDYALSFARARALIEARRPKEALAILDRFAWPSNRSGQRGRARTRPGTTGAFSASSPTTCAASRCCAWGDTTKPRRRSRRPPSRRPTTLPIGRRPRRCADRRRARLLREPRQERSHDLEPRPGPAGTRSPEGCGANAAL